MRWNVASRGGFMYAGDLAAVLRAQAQARPPIAPAQIRQANLELMALQISPLTAWAPSADTLATLEWARRRA